MSVLNSAWLYSQINVWADAVSQVTLICFSPSFKLWTGSQSWYQRHALVALHGGHAVFIRIRRLIVACMVPVVAVWGGQTVAGTLYIYICFGNARLS